MSDWKDRLADVDDDYLIGISNKGIVKRAYKDKEETAAQVIAVEEDATVKVGEETVTVRFPLGESRCSCPSRSICRHVVQAILALKESCLGGTGEAAGQVPSASGQGDAPCQEDISLQASVPNHENTQDAPCRGAALEQNHMLEPETADTQCHMPGRKADVQDDMPARSRTESGRMMGRKADAQEDMPCQASASEQDAMRSDAPAALHAEATPQAPVRTKVLQEITAYPFPKLKKALGIRPLQTLANQLAAGIRPEIQHSSVVTVRLPEAGMVVKLLSPLEYSSCTCHKKELCQHKAAAILWCQLEAGTIAQKDLLEEAADAPAYDMEEIKEAAGQMREFLEELFRTGLSRVSPDVLDYLERLAIISHNALLARFEGYFRALSDSYDRYLKRKASFRARDLMAQMARLYRRAELLLEAEDGGRVAELAGEFRADYLPAGNLNLIGIAMEHFRSQTGYEGETVYFLEENTRKWYTYTNARPVFYDTKKRRGYTEKGLSPWGLNISLEELLKVRIRLTGAKCDERNRLSASQETKGEVTGEQGLRASDLEGWYYRDFDKLFLEQIGRQQMGWLAEQNGQATEQDHVGMADTGAGAEQGDSSGDSSGGNGPRGAELVLVRPDSCAKAEFSRTGQLLTLPLYDKAGREILVEVVYSKEESSTIRYLERVSERKLPCFLGKVSLRDGRVRMYPVDLLDIEEELDREEEASEEGKASGDFCQGKKGEADSCKEPEQQGGPSAGRQTKYQAVEDIAGDVLSLMEDLCQSGFDTVHDSTLRDIRKAAELTAQYGMQYLSGLLTGMAEEIDAGRHRMERRTAPMAQLYVSINEYLYLCGQKAAYDRGESYYCVL